MSQAGRGRRDWGTHTPLWWIQGRCLGEQAEILLDGSLRTCSRMIMETVHRLGRALGIL